LAEVKTIISEATYIMGDGESPSFAEARAIQQAKQTALEQAGTYVESYTKMQNFDLTAEEIQTLAGGVLSVEVLDKQRTLVQDGLRLYVKIKAAVTTDKMEELAQRIKGRNVAAEYKKLQEDYAKLNQDIDKWKRIAAETPRVPERNTALEKVSEGAKRFGDMQAIETQFFERLVSGKPLVRRAIAERSIVDSLLRKIVDKGHSISFGEPSIHLDEYRPEAMVLEVPLAVQANGDVIIAISDETKRLGGKTWVGYKSFPTGTTIIDVSKSEAVAKYFWYQVGEMRFVLTLQFGDGRSFECTAATENEPVETFLALSSYKPFHDVWLVAVLPVQRHVTLKFSLPSTLAESITSITGAYRILSPVETEQRYGMSGEVSRHLVYLRLP
jgi:hypothetical protein